MKKTIFTLLAVCVLAPSIAKNLSSEFFSERDCTTFAVGVYTAFIDAGATGGVALQYSQDNYLDCVEKGGIANENGWEGVSLELQKL